MRRLLLEISICITKAPRTLFFSQIDKLLDEKVRAALCWSPHHRLTPLTPHPSPSPPDLRPLQVLIGSSHLSSVRSAHEALRPLACSTLADLVHHVRGELGMAHLYARPDRIGDPS